VEAWEGKHAGEEWKHGRGNMQERRGRMGGETCRKRRKKVYVEWIAGSEWRERKERKKVSIRKRKGII